MELQIFNGILFNELRPNQPQNQVDAAFIDLIREVDLTFPLTANDLFKRLKCLLTNYPRLQVFSESYLKPSSDPLVPSIFETVPFDSFDAISEFYLKLIDLESIRALNNLIIAVDSVNEKIDKQYYANIAWKNVRYIITSAQEELNNWVTFINDADKSSSDYPEKR